LASTVTTPAPAPAPDVAPRPVEDPPDLTAESVAAQASGTPAIRARDRIRRPATKLVRRSIAIVVFLLLWELLPRYGPLDPVFVPPLSEVFGAWWTLLTNGVLAEHTAASLQRSAIGFTLAVLIGVPLGLLLGWYNRLADLLDPLLELFRNTAALALLPVFVLILGLGETSKISLVLYACVWPILLNTVSGVRHVDPLLIKSARSLALDQRALFTKVILPAALPSVFTGVRLAAAYSILILVAAEMVGAKAGLGYLINYSQSNFQIQNMYAGIITISVIGVGINLALLRLERRLTGWQPASH
jgi:NitT/TauT family transport system permease protein